MKSTQGTLHLHEPILCMHNITFTSSPFLDLYHGVSVFVLFRERMQEIRRQKEKLEEKIMDIYRTPGHSPSKRKGKWNHLKLIDSEFAGGKSRLDCVLYFAFRLWSYYSKDIQELKQRLG